ncbi:unnamed protein product [Closterium sp. Naga37s-1]|nr:unnamed protein product [Closterium sp. Naga37s-1]
MSTMDAQDELEEAVSRIYGEWLARGGGRSGSRTRRVWLVFWNVHSLALLQYPFNPSPFPIPAHPSPPFHLPSSFPPHTFLSVECGYQSAMAGELQVPPGELQVPPGELQVPPGELQVPPGELQVPPGELQVPPPFELQVPSESRGRLWRWAWAGENSHMHSHPPPHMHSHPPPHMHSHPPPHMHSHPPPHMHSHPPPHMHSHPPPHMHSHPPPHMHSHPPPHMHSHPPPHMHSHPPPHMHSHPPPHMHSHPPPHMHSHPPPHMHSHPPPHMHSHPPPHMHSHPPPHMHSHPPPHMHSHPLTCTRTLSPFLSPHSPSLSPPFGSPNPAPNPPCVLCCASPALHAKQLAHLATTYAAVAALVTVGGEEALSVPFSYASAQFVLSPFPPSLLVLFPPPSLPLLLFLCSFHCSLSFLFPPLALNCNSLVFPHVPPLPACPSLALTLLRLRTRKSMLAFLRRMKCQSGGFRLHQGGETDVRGCYTAMAVADLLCIRPPDLTENVAAYVYRCQTYEGGIGGEPGAEAHGGYTFCALAAMLLAGADPWEHLNLPLLLDWLVFRQGSVEGGFQGRSNKLVDACYSLWQGGLFPLLALCSSSHTRPTGDASSAQQPSNVSSVPRTEGAGGDQQAMQADNNGEVRGAVGEPSGVAGCSGQEKRQEESGAEERSSGSEGGGGDGRGGEGAEDEEDEEEEDEEDEWEEADVESFHRVPLAAAADLFPCPESLLPPAGAGEGGERTGGERGGGEERGGEGEEGREGAAGAVRGESGDRATARGGSDWVGSFCYNNVALQAYLLLCCQVSAIPAARLVPYLTTPPQSSLDASPPFPPTSLPAPKSSHGDCLLPFHFRSPSLVCRLYAMPASTIIMILFAPRHSPLFTCRACRCQRGD